MEQGDALEGYAPAAAACAGCSRGAFSEQAVWEVLKTCYDPEIPVNIVDLGLVYDLSIEKNPRRAATGSMPR